MVIDYAHLETPPTTNLFGGVFNNNANIDLPTAELIYPVERDLQNLQISQYPNIQFVKGSIHKYGTGGRNDYNLSYNTMLDIIDNLENDLQLSADAMRIRNLEVGINVELPKTIPVSRFVDSFIIHKGCTFRDMDIYHGVGRYARHRQYRLKSYDKGTQLMNRGIQIGNVWRFEYHVNKMEFLNGCGIQTLSDLRDETILWNLKQRLLREYDATIIHDWTIDLQQMSKRQKSLLSNLYYPRYIRDIYERDRKQYQNIVRRYKTLSRIGLKPMVRGLIEQTWDNMMNGKN